MCAGLVVVAMKGGVAIDPFVVSICSDQLNDASQPTDAIILKGEDWVGPLKVTGLKRCSFKWPPTKEKSAPPNVGLADWCWVPEESCLMGFEGFGEPIKNPSIDNSQTKELIVEKNLPSTTLRAGENRNVWSKTSIVKRQLGNWLGWTAVL
jgi:hypothetical protein